MTKEVQKEIVSVDLGEQLKIWQDIAKKMERRELEEAILLELKAVQSELRGLLEDKRPKNS